MINYLRQKLQGFQSLWDYCSDLLLFFFITGLVCLGGKRDQNCKFPFEVSFASI